MAAGMSAAVKGSSKIDMAALIVFSGGDLEGCVLVTTAESRRGGDGRDMGSEGAWLQL